MPKNVKSTLKNKERKKTQYEGKNSEKLRQNNIPSVLNTLFWHSKYTNTAQIFCFQTIAIFCLIPSLCCSSWAYSNDIAYCHRKIYNFSVICVCMWWKRKRTLLVESRKKNEHCRAVVVVVVTPSEKKQGFVFVCSFVRSWTWALAQCARLRMLPHVVSEIHIICRSLYRCVAVKHVCMCVCLNIVFFFSFFIDGLRFVSINAIAKGVLL